MQDWHVRIEKRFPTGDAVCGPLSDFLEASRNRRRSPFKTLGVLPETVIEYSGVSRLRQQSGRAGQQHQASGKCSLHIRNLYRHGRNSRAISLSKKKFVFVSDLPAFFRPYQWVEIETSNGGFLEHAE